MMMMMVMMVVMMTTTTFSKRLEALGLVLALATWRWKSPTSSAALSAQCARCFKDLLFGGVQVLRGFQKKKIPLKHQAYDLSSNVILEFWNSSNYTPLLQSPPETSAKNLFRIFKNQPRRIQIQVHACAMYVHQSQNHPNHFLLHKSQSSHTEPGGRVGHSIQAIQA